MTSACDEEAGERGSHNHHTAAAAGSGCVMDWAGIALLCTIWVLTADGSSSALNTTLWFWWGKTYWIQLCLCDTVIHFSLAIKHSQCSDADDKMKVIPINISLRLYPI